MLSLPHKHTLAPDACQPPRKPELPTRAELRLLRAILDNRPDPNGHPTLQVLRLLVKLERTSAAAIHLGRAIEAILCECPWEREEAA